MSDLTPRELDVLFHAAHGLNQKQIAAELQLHPETVTKAIRESQRKLDANNLTHAVAIAIRRGLIVLVVALLLLVCVSEAQAAGLEAALQPRASWGM